MRRALLPKYALALFIAAQGCRGAEACLDGVDSDQDGFTDCADPDCADEPVCKELDCEDGQDGDQDGAVDCADPDCFGGPACDEVCGDGLDNDQDGRVDCRDSECVALPECDEDCDDGLDNDQDGAEDCLDAGCDLDPGCAEDCQDGVDNDRDGALDCRDAFCGARPECVEDCDDGLDNDQDGEADCGDLDCAFRPPCAAPGGVATLDLGTLGPGEPAEFFIPPGAQGFTITIEGAPTSEYRLFELRNPLGNLLVSDGEGVGLRQFPNVEAFGLVIPPNERPANAPLPGVWRLAIASSLPGDSARVGVHVRLGPFDGGLLDLKLYIPAGLRACLDAGCGGGFGQAMTAATAASFAEIQGMLHTFFAEFYADEGGFAPGGVQFFDIGAEFLLVSDLAEFDEMLTLSGLGGAGGLHVFLVQEVFDGAATIGIASGIPGALGTAGNRNSGVMAEILLDPALESNLGGSLLAHEIGHFLGLDHTTEFNGETDLIGDTPSCPEELISSDPESCPDVDFMMFPRLLDGKTRLSAGQTLPMRAGRAYR